MSYWTVTLEIPHWQMNVALKISRIIGVFALLRHLAPLTTQLSIYRFLILPYLSYGLAAWGEAAKSYLQKVLMLQKLVLGLMYISEPRVHACMRCLDFGTPFAMNSVKNISMTLVLLSLLEAKDEYDKAPILLKKIANHTVKFMQ